MEKGRLGELVSGIALFALVTGLGGFALYESEYGLERQQWAAGMMFGLCVIIDGILMYMAVGGRRR